MLASRSDLSKELAKPFREASKPFYCKRNVTFFCLGKLLHSINKCTKFPAVRVTEAHLRTSLNKLYR